MSNTTINQYIKIVDFLGKALGPDFEIVLHDLRPGKKSVAAISNGHVSGRTLDAPLTDFALKLIAQKTYENSDYALNYKGFAQNGKMLRASTFFIKDEKGVLVGMLCINFDISRFQNLKSSVFELLDSYLPETKPQEDIMSKNECSDVIENFSPSVSDLIESTLNSELSNSNLPIDRLTKEEKLNIVEVLNDRGVFLIKGSVNEVAERLCCSEASIYRYLGNINKKTKDRAK